MPKAQPPKVLNRKDFVYMPSDLEAQVTPNKVSAAAKGEIASAQAPTVVAEGEPNAAAVNATTTHQDQVYFPRVDSEREIYRTKSGKKLTQYQWDIYDFILRIPEGKVTTYKIISQSVGGSARSVGGALRANPFSPYVPCHRVVASNLYIGGFFGQWAGRKATRTSRGGQSGEADPPEVQDKITMLSGEGVSVDGRGFLEDAGDLIWKPAKDM